MTSLSLYSSKSRYTVFGLFFLYFLLEASIGGSGGLIQIREGLTIRKVNFTIALSILGVIFLFRKKLPRNIAAIIVCFLITLVIATTLGLFNYGANPKIVENLLMQSFFLLLPFYSFFITTEKDVRVATNIIKFAAMTIALVFLIVVVLLAIGVLDFLTLYAYTIDSQEFMGRGQELFWYKGFLYLCLGFFFIDIENKVFVKRCKQVFLLVAIYFTFTRGFILALFGAFILHQFFFRNLIKSLLMLVFALAIILGFNQYYASKSFDRGESDEIRITQFQQVMSEVDPVSFFIGHGFGEGVRVRDNHMEINYLEIFHKQGLLGLAFWWSLLAYITILYINCRRLGKERQARPFFLSTLFIYIQSATNPFLTNSIGLNMIMIVIVSLHVYLQTGKEQSGDTLLLQAQ